MIVALYTTLYSFIVFVRFYMLFLNKLEQYQLTLDRVLIVIHYIVSIIIGCIDTVIFTKAVKTIQMFYI